MEKIWNDETQKYQTIEEAGKKYEEVWNQRIQDYEKDLQDEPGFQKKLEEEY